MENEPKTKTDLAKFLQRGFRISRVQRSPMEHCLTGSDGQPIKDVHVYGDPRNLKALSSEMPAGVNIVHHPSIADGEVYKAQP